MRLRHREQARPGAALVEAALVVTVFITLVMGAFDMGMAAFRLHVLSQAAREGVRQAIVHGKLAPSAWKGGPWGPSTFGPVSADNADPKAQAVAPFLTGMDLSTVNVTYEWPDNSNVSEKRVRVTLTTSWTPMMSFIFGGSSHTLSASSMMPIAH